MPSFGSEKYVYTFSLVYFFTLFLHEDRLTLNFGSFIRRVASHATKDILLDSFDIQICEEKKPTTKRSLSTEKQKKSVNFINTLTLQFAGHQM